MKESPTMLGIPKHMICYDSKNILTWYYWEFQFKVASWEFYPLVEIITIILNFKSAAPYSSPRSHRLYDDRTRSDELIAAKIKNFLAVSYTPDVVYLSVNGCCNVRCSAILQ